MRKVNQNGIMLLIVVLIFSILFLTIIGRYMYIQVTGEVHSVDLVAYAENMRETNTTLQAERGKIYDRSGMALADNRPVYNMYAILDETYTGNSSVPLHLEDAEHTAQQLSNVLDEDVESIKSRIQNGIDNDRYQIEFGSLGQGLSEAEYEAIEELELPGIYFEQTLQRYYPNGLYASQIIGYTGYTDDEEQTQARGAYGIELEFDEYLTGKDGFINYQRDSYGHQLRNAEETVQSPEDGFDIHLTIDQKIQSFLEDALTTVEEAYSPERIMAGVMDPNTGEILAMSNRPTFDPNTRDNIENWYNDMISSPFEPGSTMKIFTLAAAIEEGVYNGNETFQSGQFQINEHSRTINDHDRDGWGEITFDEGILRSSNVAMAELLWDKMGPETYLEYLEDFHLDRMTGVDLTGERIGTISYGGPWEQITTAYGQGSTFTPMQIMKAATALANDGEIVQPYVLSNIQDPNNGQLVEQKDREVVGDPISPDTVEQIKDLLGQTVTEEEGTANAFALDQYTTFGKTGTASIPDPETGLYMSGGPNYYFSFVGMAPQDDPQLLMFVAVKQPDVDYRYQGSETTSYIYRTVMENSLHYLDVSPDQENITHTDETTINDYSGQSVENVTSELSELGFPVDVIGEGNTVESTWPTSGSQVFTNQRVLLRTDDQMTMPDLTGWTLRDVIALSRMTNIDLDYIGSGLVIDQNIEAGNTFSEDRRLVVELSEERNDSEEDEEEEDEEYFE
ncbi:penicillin-binding protein [Alkalibacillus haloalkaliphilus]|uniref:penicillin-binding protein n=1 Tax=Alkalibacillus haloalkaliphilus TaxID=94136 RepID=UPI0029353EEA|nr:penicillin-binding protein [Alkalibacillus haloalkaliphilus]MDV2582544.1 penicillin-binding protein [Alkalibacillus haloalkaliphilus]